jgi:UDP-GlcNAc:undecaprenyl-phosphate GlcNAc-1-phosphate transferase
LLNFPSNVYVLALASAALISGLTLPVWRNLCLRLGLVDDPGHRKIHDKPIPLAGGPAVLSGLALPLLFGVCLLASSAPPGIERWLDPATVPLLAHGLGHRAIQLAAIAVGALGMAAIGLLDDKHELRPGPKFGGQLLVALLVAAAGVRITLFVPNVVFSFVITVLWILTVTNAFNFMDNMNGLCAGLGVIGAGFFALIAAGDGQYLVALLAILTCGALLGFLPYNFPKASAFLGDSGSHLVGYLLAVLAILPHFYTPQKPRVLAVFTPLLILAVPLLDLACVVILRWRMGQPFYLGDTNHLSHRLVRRGLSSTQAAMLIWLLAAIVGSLVLL